jgi:hypothetical protein
MMELCRSLRWKGWYAVEVFTATTLAEHVTANEVPYSCLRTCQAWGPDDAPATPERCDGTRPCFSPSPKLLRPTT